MVCISNAAAKVRARVAEHRVGRRLVRGGKAACAAGFVAVLAGLFARVAYADGPPTPAVGEVSAMFAVTLAGASVDLAADHGWKVVYFWSSFCPCVSACEHYTLKPLAEKYAGRIHFYAVVSGSFDLKMPPTELRAKIAARDLPYPVLLDVNHEIVQALGAVVTPQTFIIDPQGRVLFNGVPDDSRRYLYRTGKSGITQSYLAEALTQALAGKPVTRPQVRDQGCIIAY